MKLPRAIGALVRRVAPADRLDDVIGDLEEAHRRRLERRGRIAAWLLTTLEGLDMALALARPRRLRLPVSGLDVRLSLRMLRRYPGLTIVAGLALAFAIAVGALTFEVVTQVLRPTLPIADGDRLVGFRLWNAETARDVPATAADLEAWRTQLRSIDHVGAFRSTTRNFITTDGRSESIAIAEISAAAFDAVRVPAHLGRTLVASDEAPGAPGVVVIDFDLWQERFDGDRDVLGRAARLGATPVTIVGVMPEAFGFPVVQDAWVPLRSDAMASPRRDSPAVGFAFGRLAPGVVLASAHAEVEALGARIARDFPDTNAHVTSAIQPYAQALLNLPTVGRLALQSTNLGAVLFVVLIAANVALLMFARTVSREAELAMRNALGASRGRIVTQLFIETLVLALVSAAAGLAVASVATRWLFQIVEIGLGVDRWPFWFHAGLSPLTVVYAIGLAVLVAAIAGAGPGLRVTSAVARWKSGAAGGSTVRFGGIWTGVIVTQVALTVACVPIVFDVGWDTSRFATFDLGVPADDYLTSRLIIPDDTPVADGQSDGPAAARVRFETTRQALIQELIATAGVRSAAYGTPPGAYAPLRFIDVDGPAAPARSTAGHRPQVASVAPGFFDALGARIVSGRDFGLADTREGSAVVVVNESFVREVLGGGAAVGRRLRIRNPSAGEAGPGPSEPDPWLEIVGVATDLMLTADPDRRSNAGIYTPLSSWELPADLIVHVPEESRAFAPTLRAVAARVDPALRVSTVSTLGDLVRSDARFYAFWFRLSLVVVGVLLLLSLAGIYAVVSFTVSRRTREIGIRVALGAERVRLLADVLGTPMRRVIIGATAGAAAVTMLPLLTDGYVAPWLLGLIAGSAALVVAVSVLACTVPIRRALRIQPTEALRSAD